MKGHGPFDRLGRRHTYSYWNDFDHEVDANELVVTSATTGTAVVGEGRFGIIPLTTAATNNDDVTIEAPNQVVGFEYDYPWQAAFLLQFDEVNLDDANVAFGLATGPAANMLVNDGAGLATGLTSVAAMWKVDGENRWRCTAGASSATQQANRKVTNIPASPGIAGKSGIWQWAEIIWTPASSNLGHVEFRINDYHAHDVGIEGQPRIRIPVVIGAGTTMSMFASVKAGAAAIEVLNIDLWGLEGARNRNVA